MSKRYQIRPPMKAVYLAYADASRGWLRTWYLLLAWLHR